MPGCLGLDAMWQMVGFYLGWIGGEGRGRALGLGELKFSGQVLPNARKVVYNVDIKRVMRSKLVLGIADGWLSMDGEIIYRAKDLKVGLFKQGTGAGLNARSRSDISARELQRRQRQGEAIMRRVVITGMGIVSSIGNNTQEVLASLHEAKSGITRAEKYAEMGFRSQVQGAPTLDPSDVIDRRAMRFLGEGAAWNHIAMEQAIQDSGLSPTEVSNVRTGIIMGSGGPSARTIVEAADITRSKGPKRVGPFAVPKAMSSTASATLATWFKIKGVNYSISSACATSNHCIGNAYETIQIGKQDVIFAGGCEELDWTLSVLFDAMGAMSSKYNDTPATASRPYDVSRDGFVIAGGAGVVVLEELEHAKARGARIYAEVVGYGATSDGYDMVAPSGEGAERCMRMAMATVKTPIDYINPHAHLDAGRRSAGNRGDPKSVRHRRQVPADLGDQGADRPLARRHRRAGGDLFAADDEQRLRLRERQHHRARSGVRRHADRAQAHRQRQARHRAVELLRLRRHQRHAGVQADGCVISLLSSPRLRREVGRQRMATLQRSEMGSA